MKKTLLCILAIFLPLSIFAQEITGIATYKTQRKIDIQLDSSQVDDGMREQMMAMIQKQFQREYTLEFDMDESVYKQVEKLDQPSAMTGGNGIQVMTIGAGNSDVLYRNTSQKRYVNQNEVFGKMFLIKDSIQKVDWQLEKETKSIGDYTCFKATYTTTRTVRSSVATSEDGESDNTDNTVEEEVTVTAWYTPQIPVSHGPAEYGGLPGLILEISDGKLSILCSKVVINPKSGVLLEEPDKGKEVSQQEYDQIVEKKVDEMNQRYAPTGRRGEHNRMEIRIGG